MLGFAIWERVLGRARRGVDQGGGAAAHGSAKGMIRAQQCTVVAGCATMQLWLSAWPHLAAGWWRTTTAQGGCAFLRKNGREERRSAGVAAIDGGAVKEARSSGATTARGGERGHGGHGTEAQQLLGEEPPWTVALQAVVVQGTATQRRSGWRRGCRRRYD
ncbi:hypothetical protein SESBI_11467 [Sesbania bispinosa]|nr:hypothetical protein SESBI_11467 [Sesbania bispinosa]